MQILLGQVGVQKSDGELRNIMSEVDRAAHKSGYPFVQARRARLSPMAWTLVFELRDMEADFESFGAFDVQPGRVMAELISIARRLGHGRYFIRGTAEWFDGDGDLEDFWDSRPETIRSAQQIFMGLPLTLSVSIGDPVVSIPVTWLNQHLAQHYARPQVDAGELFTGFTVAATAVTEILLIAGPWLYSVVPVENEMRITA